MSCQSIGVDALLRLDAHFNSPDMKTIRSNAAAFLLKYQFGQHHVLPTGNRIVLESLLDFFEGIALFPSEKAHQTQKVFGASFSRGLSAIAGQQNASLRKHKRMIH
jgi:hypothetical protein